MREEGYRAGIGDKTAASDGGVAAEILGLGSCKAMLFATILNLIVMEKQGLMIGMMLEHYGKFRNPAARSIK